MMIFYYLFNKPICYLGLMIIFIQFMKVAPREIDPFVIVFIILYFITFLSIFLHYMLASKTMYSTSIDAPLLVLILLMISSLLMARIYEVTFGEFFRQLAPFMGLLFYYFLKEELKDLHDIKLITYFIIIAASINIIRIFYGLLVVGWAYSLKEAITLRGFHDPVIFGPLIFALLGFLTGYLACSEKRHFFLWILLGLSLFAHFFTFSRSAILNYGIILIAYLWIIRKKTNLFLFLLKYGAIFLMLSSIILVLAYNYTSKGKKLVDGLHRTYHFRFTERGGYSNRIEEMKSSLNELSESYGLGKGLGVKLTFSKFLNTKNSYVVQAYTHNIIMYLLFTLGLPGILVFLWLCWNVFSLAKKTGKKLRDTEALAYLYGYMLSLICVIVYCLFESVYRHFIFSLYVALTLAILARLSRIAAASPSQGLAGMNLPPTMNSKVPATLVG